MRKAHPVAADILWCPVVVPTLQTKGNIYIRIKEFVTIIAVVSLDVICKIKNIKAFFLPIETVLFKTIRKNFLMVESTQGDKLFP